MNIDISNIDKAKLFAALYDRAKPQGMGFLHYDPAGMTIEEATDAIDKSTYFDYYKGRVMKVNISGDELDSRLYDRDNGNGSAYAVIEAIRSSNAC